MNEQQVKNSCQKCGKECKLYPSGEKKGQPYPYCSECNDKHKEKSQPKTKTNEKFYPCKICKEDKCGVRNDTGEPFKICLECNILNRKKCDDGHRVWSRGEMLIDNWLYNNGYAHAYEKRVPFGVEDSDERMLCDFYIPSRDIYIEYWGLEDDKDYDLRREVKEKYYNKNNIVYASIENDDFKNLDEVLYKIVNSERRKDAIATV